MGGETKDGGRGLGNGRPNAGQRAVSPRDDAGFRGEPLGVAANRRRRAANRLRLTDAEKRALRAEFARAQAEMEAQDTARLHEKFAKEWREHEATRSPKAARFDSYLDIFSYQDKWDSAARPSASSLLELPDGVLPDTLKLRDRLWEPNRGPSDSEIANLWKQNQGLSFERALEIGRAQPEEGPRPKDDEDKLEGPGAGGDTTAADVSKLIRQFRPYGNPTLGSAARIITARQPGLNRPSMAHAVAAAWVEKNGSVATDGEPPTQTITRDLLDTVVNDHPADSIASAVKGVAYIGAGYGALFGLERTKKESYQYQRVPIDDEDVIRVTNVLRVEPGIYFSWRHRLQEDLQLAYFVALHKSRPFTPPVLTPFALETSPGTPQFNSADGGVVIVLSPSYFKRRTSTEFLAAVVGKMALATQDCVERYLVPELKQLVTGFSVKQLPALAWEIIKNMIPLVDAIEKARDVYRLYKITRIAAGGKDNSVGDLNVAARLLAPFLVEQIVGAIVGGATRLAVKGFKLTSKGKQSARQGSRTNEPPATRPDADPPTLDHSGVRGSGNTNNGLDNSARSNTGARDAGPNGGAARAREAELPRERLASGPESGDGKAIRRATNEDEKGIFSSGVDALDEEFDAYERGAPVESRTRREYTLIGKFTNPKLFHDTIKEINENHLAKAIERAKQGMQQNRRGRVRQSYAAESARLAEIEKRITALQKAYPGKIRGRARRQIAKLINEAQEIGKRRYNNLRSRVWEELVNDPQTRPLLDKLVEAGDLQLQPAGRAAKSRVVTRDAAGTETVAFEELNLDHATPKSINPFRAIDETNLRIAARDENVRVLETIRRESDLPVSPDGDEIEIWLLQNGLSAEGRTRLLGSE